MTRRDLFRAVGLTAAAAAARASARKPNFVFILIDDMGWRDLGCYGSKLFETPNIDRVAQQGMRFTDAYSAANVCSPTRAALMTGKSPARLAMTAVISDPGGCSPKRKLCTAEFLRGLPLTEVSLAKALKGMGYVSACIGKWHLGGAGLSPKEHGFDVTSGSSEIGMVHDHFYPGWAQEQVPPVNARGEVPIDGKPGDYLADRLTDEALGFIASNKNRPFFLYLSHYAVHTPIQGKKELVEKYQKKVTPDDPQRNPIYAAMVESVDQSVGRIVAKLDELGIAGDSVLIITSDNGGLNRREPPSPPTEPPPTSNSPLRLGKQTLYEGGIRVPLIVRWPGVVKAGVLSATPVISMDFCPTLVELAGGKPKPIDGVSLAGLLRGKGAPRRTALYWHAPHYGGSVGPGAVIREGRYKLIEFFDPPRVELYDLKDDLGESNNLAASMPDKVKDLQGRLHAWLKSAGARMMRPNPDYKAPAPKS